MGALLLLCGCRFGPLDLLGDAEGARVPLLLERQQHSLCWTGSSKQVLQQRATDAAFQEAADAGLKAAHKVCMCVCVLVWVQLHQLGMLLASHCGSSPLTCLDLSACKHTACYGTHPHALYIAG